jgi:hypothetical protein
MPVVDYYADASIEAGKKGSALNTMGTQTITAVATVAVASGDDDGSVYRLFAGVPSNLVPVMITVHNTAITAGTDYDLGLYKTKDGAVVDKDILADGLDMSSARTIATLNNAGMTTVAIANGTQDLGTLSAQTDPDMAYDVCLTANTVGSAAGTIRVTAVFAYL